MSDEQLSFKLLDPSIGTPNDQNVYSVTWAVEDWGSFVPQHKTYASMYQALNKLEDMGRERGVEVMDLARLPAFLNGEINSLTVISVRESKRNRLMIERL